jgi:hypothetical protein
MYRPQAHSQYAKPVLWYVACFINQYALCTTFDFQPPKGNGFPVATLLFALFMLGSCYTCNV